MLPALASGQGALVPRRSCFSHLFRALWAKGCFDVWQFGPWHTPWSGLEEVLGGRSTNYKFLQYQQSWLSLPILAGLRNTDMAFSEILIRDGQTRGKKIRNPFALFLGLKKVQLTFFLPHVIFPFSAGSSNPGSSRVGMWSC